MNKDIINKIKTEITGNQVHPSQFEISPEEIEFLEKIQDDLFDKLNNIEITFIPSNSDTILTHLIIAKRVHPEISINEFIQIYSEEIPYIPS
jgi:hypothetical protein